MLPFSLRSSLDQLQLTPLKEHITINLSVHDPIDPIAVAFFIELPKSFSKKEILWSASLDLLTQQIRFRHVFRPKMAQMIKQNKGKTVGNRWDLNCFDTTSVPLMKSMSTFRF